MGRMSDQAIEDMETPIMAPCPDCHGDGYIVYNVPKRQDFNRDVGYLEQVREVCESCSGDGEMPRLCDCGEAVTVGMGEDAEQCEECASCS